MKPLIVVVTGSSKGIGFETAKYFLERGCVVHGIDIDSNKIGELHPDLSNRYIHHVADVSNADQLPIIDHTDILVNNAGVQNTSRDIAVNLCGVINCTERYGLTSDIKSIVNLASVSAHNGAEFPEYVASKGGVLAYTKWTAKEVAKYGATCNSLSFGGVLTELNRSVTEDAESWNAIMSMTPLKKWMTPYECAQWIYFVSVVNKSMSGQDIVIDNLETLNHQFVWK